MHPSGRVGPRPGGLKSIWQREPSLSINSGRLRDVQRTFTSPLSQALVGPLPSIMAKSNRIRLTTSSTTTFLPPTPRNGSIRRTRQTEGGSSRAYPKAPMQSSYRPLTGRKMPSRPGARAAFSDDNRSCFDSPLLLPVTGTVWRKLSPGNKARP